MNALRPISRIAVAGFCGVLLGLLAPSSLWANIGTRWWGDLAADPQGLKGVAITREKLTIDLRPLADLQPAEVEAVYQLYNHGPERKLDLLFVSGTPGMSGFEVRFNEKPLVLEESSGSQHPRVHGELPASWKPPMTLPGIDGKETYFLIREWSEFNPRPFSLVLPSGHSTLAVRYRSRACGTDETPPMATWQFPYILAPASSWGSFGGLDVMVYVPEGWQSSSTLALEREENVLRGSFEGLPADVLAVAARAPLPLAYQRARYIYPVLHVSVLLAGGFLCWCAGRIGGRFLSQKTATEPGTRLRRNGSMVLLGVLMAFLWAAAIYGSLHMLVYGIHDSLQGQEGPSFHGSFMLEVCGSFLLMLLTIPLGIWLTWTGASRSLKTVDSRKP
jgi:hypothetical protein